VRLLLALLLAVPLAGCATQFTVARIDAEVAVEGARAAGAANTATYEFTGAEAYLHEARLKAGYAQYEAAIAFARRAQALAAEAKDKAIAASNRNAPRDETVREVKP
jgi:hypothetical protein